MTKIITILIGILGLTGLVAYFSFLNLDLGAEIPKVATMQEIDITKLQNKEFIENIRKTDSVIVERGFTKTYSKKRLTIKNKKKLIDAELLSSYKQMIGAGNSVMVAELKLKDWQDKNSLFDSLEFFNRKNWQKEEKQFVLKWCEEKTITMELPADFPEEIEGNKLFEKIVGDWDNATEFETLDELPHKDIRIGIFTKTVLNEKIEWLPTIDGFNIYEWAAYDITELNDLEHDTADGRYNSFVMIDTTHFILAYAGVDYDGYIKTFSIDGSYNITQIDSLEHDTLNGAGNSLVMIDTTHFILAYRGNGSDGYIKTFSIDGNYDNITQIDSLEHDIAYGGSNSLVKIDSTHFILAYMGNGSDGYIKTFSIDGNYDNITQIDSLEHDIAYGGSNSLVKIDSTHFILAYMGNGSDGYIKTFSIDGSYNITQIDSLEHDIAYGGSNSLVKIDTTHFILAYTGYAPSSNRGFITTFSTDGSYNITEIDSLSHDVGGGKQNSLVMIDSTHFILAYADYYDDGFIKTLSIDGSYNITEIDSLEHDTTFGYYNSLIMLDSTHFILAYQADAYAAGDGFIKTFSIDGNYDNITEVNSLEHDTVTGGNNSLVKIDATHLILAYEGTDNDGYVKTFSIEAAAGASRRIIITQ